MRPTRPDVARGGSAGAPLAVGLDAFPARAAAVGPGPRHPSGTTLARTGSTSLEPAAAGAVAAGLGLAALRSRRVLPQDAGRAIGMGLFGKDDKGKDEGAREADVAGDDAQALSRVTGGDDEAEGGDADSTTGAGEAGTFVGRDAGQDEGYAGETGAERRASGA